MTTLEKRIAEFATGAPPGGRKLQVLCLDKNGTYELPFPCVWNSATGAWMNGEVQIDAQVIGWRDMPPEMAGKRRSA